MPAQQIAWVSSCDKGGWMRECMHLELEVVASYSFQAMPVAQLSYQLSRQWIILCISLRKISHLAARCPAHILSINDLLATQGILGSSCLRRSTKTVSWAASVGSTLGSLSKNCYTLRLPQNISIFALQPLTNLFYWQNQLS